MTRNVALFLAATMALALATNAQNLGPSNPQAPSGTEQRVLLPPGAPPPVKPLPGQRPIITDMALDTALTDKRYLMRQLKCALGEGPCDPVGKRLKSLAPLVLRGSCPQCSPQETRQIQRSLSHIQRTYPKEWIKIVKQYVGF